jgi:alkanesulfonate monooxygenase SsuD/methylene tetrahydromethanopterin reductase-like flavin-dependent oxidoreductase (luciferase family)
MPDLKLAINLWCQTASWQEMLDAARRIDRLGYDQLYTWDHLYAIFGDPYQPTFEAWTALSAWAMATERVQLGLMVGANPFRNPGLVAKTATTLDHISGGRAILGLGAAWFEPEHRAFGIDFGASVGQRLDWLDEAVGACRTLLEGGTVTSPAGGRYAFDDVRIAPLPVQRHMPILIGGTGRRKTLRTVARYADMWNAFGLPDEVRELNDVLREHCADVGRDEREIERSINLWMVIRNDEAEARRVWAEAMAHNQTPVERTMESSRPIFGPPAAIAARLREYVDAGFGTTLVELPSPYDVETIERLIGEVKPLVDAG